MFFLCYITFFNDYISITSVLPTNTALPPLPEQSCCAAFDWDFWVGGALVRVRARVLGQEQSHGVWAGVIQPPIPPHGPGAALNHSPNRGVSLIPRWPISDSVGAPDSSRRRPNLSPLECEFPDLCLQIAHLQRCRSCREYISRVADAERPEPPPPRYSTIIQ